MAAEAAVSFAVETLCNLLMQKVVFLKSVKGEVEWVRDELRRMQGFLKDAAKKQSDSYHFHVYNLYNIPKIAGQFDSRAWVVVSSEFTPEGDIGEAGGSRRWFEVSRIGGRQAEAPTKTEGRAVQIPHRKTILDSSGRCVGTQTLAIFGKLFS